MRHIKSCGVYKLLRMDETWQCTYKEAPRGGGVRTAVRGFGLVEAPPAAIAVFGVRLGTLYAGAAGAGARAGGRPRRGLKKSASLTQDSPALSVEVSGPSNHADFEP